MASSFQLHIWKSCLCKSEQHWAWKNSVWRSSAHEHNQTNFLCSCCFLFKNTCDNWSIWWFEMRKIEPQKRDVLVKEKQRQDWWNDFPTKQNKVVWERKLCWECQLLQKNNVWCSKVLRNCFRNNTSHWLTIFKSIQKIIQFEVVKKWTDRGHSHSVFVFHKIQKGENMNKWRNETEKLTFKKVISIWSRVSWKKQKWFDWSWRCEFASFVDVHFFLFWTRVKKETSKFAQRVVGNNFVMRFKLQET